VSVLRISVEARGMEGYYSCRVKDGHVGES
jgi:hypothetical protein